MPYNMQKQSKIMKVQYKLPNGLLDKFVNEALANKNDNIDHSETLALVIGHMEENVLIAREMVFPIQIRSSQNPGKLIRDIIFSMPIT